MRRLGFCGGGGPRRAKRGFSPSRTLKIPNRPPRTRPERPEKAGGEGGGAVPFPLPPPLFPGLLGPLQAAVGGLPWEGRTPDPDPGLPPTL